MKTTRKPKIGDWILVKWGRSSGYESLWIPVKVISISSSYVVSNNP